MGNETFYGDGLIDLSLALAGMLLSSSKLFLENICTDRRICLPLFTPSTRDLGDLRESSFIMTSGGMKILGGGGALKIFRHPKGGLWKN